MSNVLTEFQLEYGRRKLAEYDLRKPHAYKNQLIGLRNDIKRTTGLGIRELRKVLEKSS